MQSHAIKRDETRRDETRQDETSLLTDVCVFEWRTVCCMWCVMCVVANCTNVVSSVRNTLNHVKAKAKANHTPLLSPISTSGRVGAATGVVREGKRERTQGGKRGGSKERRMEGLGSGGEGRRDLNSPVISRHHRR